MRLSFKSVFSLNPVSLTFFSILLVVVLFLTGISILDLIELKTYDLRFLSRGHLQPSPAVVMALIDEKSLDTEGRWPWPRSKLAKLVDILSEDGAKVIGFDIGFLEPDENSQLGLIDQLGQKVNALDIKDSKLAEFINESKKAADNDVALANAIKNSSAKVVLGYFFHMNAADLNYTIEEAEIDRQIDRIIDSRYPFITYEDPEMESAPFIQAYAPESDLEIFTSAAHASGFFSVAADQDGVVRWMPLIIECAMDIFPPLAVASTWLYLDQPQLMVNVARYGVEGIKMGERFIPTDENGQLFINYLGPPKTFPHFSISDILSGKLPKGTFKEKLVLVGATAMGTHDLRSTPFSPLYPGVEIHATVIDNILTQNFITRPRWSMIYDLLIIILLGTLIGIALPRTSAMKGLFIASGLFILHILVARWLFVNSRVWLNIVYPLLVLVITYTALTLYHYMTEERERRKVKGAFKHYVSHDVIEEMLKEPGRLQLGGEEKVITVLFSDLAGFTSYSERYAPREMINILSEYFENMTEQIFAHQGTLKEYVGDELMAIFGAPVEQADHAKRACATALAMRDRLQAMRRDWAEIGRPALRARTGINTGPMLVGNIGSKYRFAYGALGDHVNLRSRLEGLNKVYGTEILLSETTAELAQGSFRFREMDLVRVKGRKQPVRIYELVDNFEAQIPKEKEQSLSEFAAGLEAYRQQFWEEARGLFEQSLALWSEDTASRVMAERCQIYQEMPPPEEWDGVFEMKTK
jgi:adenylate cyclase